MSISMERVLLPDDARVNETVDAVVAGYSKCSWYQTASTMNRIAAILIFAGIGLAITSVVLGYQSNALTNRVLITAGISIAAFALGMVLACRTYWHDPVVYKEKIRKYFQCLRDAGYAQAESYHRGVRKNCLIDGRKIREFVKLTSIGLVIQYAHKLILDDILSVPEIYELIYAETTANPKLKFRDLYFMPSDVPPSRVILGGSAVGWLQWAIEKDPSLKDRFHKEFHDTWPSSIEPKEQISKLQHIENVLKGKAPDKQRLKAAKEDAEKLNKLFFGS